MKKFISLFVLALTLYVVPAQAAISTELLEAVNKIYNGSFSSAKKIINTHIQANPNDPAGYILRGISNEWYQLARNKGKSLNGTIMADYQKARQLAITALETDSNNLELQTMLGNAYMYISKKQIDSGHKLQAGSTLKKSKNIMEEVLSKDPNHKEAFFAIGLFNFFSANVPSGFKWLATLLGFRGTTEKGLEYIRKAASSPNLTQGDAKFMMVYAYSQKLGQYANALPYAESLNRSYPNNQVFLFDLAEMQHRTKKTEESRQNFSKFFDYCEKFKGHCSQKYLFLSHYFMTWSYMNDKDYENAKKYFSKAKELDTNRYKDRSADLQKWAQILEKK